MEYAVIIVIIIAAITFIQRIIVTANALKESTRTVSEKTTIKKKPARKKSSVKKKPARKK